MYMTNLTTALTSMSLTQTIAPPRRFPFVTNYRAGMLLTTAVCVLAVDFPVFPRRLAKGRFH